MYEADPAKPAEPLIVDIDHGALKHLDDPIAVGQVEFYILQYVTWVDHPDLADPDNNPDHDYKRVVVVATWKSPLRSGPTNRVIQSTYVSDGKVSLPEEGPGGGGPGSTATPAPTFTPPPLIGDLLGIGQLLFPAPPQEPNPNGPCPADAQGPTASLSVLSGAGAELGYLSSTSVQLKVTANDSCRIPPDDPPNDITAYFSDCDDASTPTPTPTGSPSPTPTGLVPTPTPTPCTYTEVGKLEAGIERVLGWSVPAGDGRRRIYARFHDANGLISGTYAVDVILDQTRPTIPTNLRKVSITCSGNDRSAGMTWDTSTDTNFVGYRVFKSLADPTYPKIESGVTHNHVGPKKDVVSFTVRAYDKAGNESVDSNQFSLTKNQCS